MDVKERNRNKMSEYYDCSPNNENPSKKQKASTSKTNVKFMKAPQAPRRFKSAYMFFSTAKHPEIRARITQDGKTAIKTTDVAKLVSKAWKNLSYEEREKWDDMSRKDKARFELEKSKYTGPWKIPKMKGSDRDPNKPKRPMSCFLSYSNSKRSAMKKEYPNKSNAELSRILAQRWKEAPEEERNVHKQKEKKLREVYKKAMQQYKKNTEEKFVAQWSEQKIRANQDQTSIQLPHLDLQQQTGTTYNSTAGSTSCYPGLPHHDYAGTAALATTAHHHHYRHDVGLNDMYSSFRLIRDGGTSSGGTISDGGGVPPSLYQILYGQQRGKQVSSHSHHNYACYERSFVNDHAAQDGGHQQPYNSEYSNSSGAGVASSIGGYGGYYAAPFQPRYNINSTRFGGSDQYHHDEGYDYGASYNVDDSSFDGTSLPSSSIRTNYNFL